MKSRIGSLVAAIAVVLGGTPLPAAAQGNASRAATVPRTTPEDMMYHRDRMQWGLKDTYETTAEYEARIKEVMSFRMEDGLPFGAPRMYVLPTPTAQDMPVPLRYDAEAQTLTWSVPNTRDGWSFFHLRDCTFFHGAAVEPSVPSEVFQTCVTATMPATSNGIKQAQDNYGRWWQYEQQERFQTAVSLCWRAGNCNADPSVTVPLTRDRARRLLDRANGTMRTAFIGTPGRLFRREFLYNRQQQGAPPVVMTTNIEAFFLDLQALVFIDNATNEVILRVPTDQPSRRAR